MASHPGQSLSFFRGNLIPTQMLPVLGHGDLDQAQQDSL